ncbi:hypothetical protein SPFL3102_00385 [Sporomusaceae bacterium FL31]|nr:hypothetical protein SPFL3101_01877 [Sporomusaceae bacterium FL31]GCE32596.1 hypothetical protein SPFL3102_00385 [Sporomusaceae bacterium]
MAGTGSGGMFIKLIDSLPNPTLIFIGGFKLTLIHSVLFILFGLSFFIVKKISTLDKYSSTVESQPDMLNTAILVLNIFIPFVLLIGIIIYILRR